jgi:hypothetical protein
MAFRHEFVEEEGYVSLRIYEDDADEPVMFLDLHADVYANFDADAGLITKFTQRMYNGRKVIASANSGDTIGEMEMVSISLRSEEEK